MLFVFWKKNNLKIKKRINGWTSYCITVEQKVDHGPITWTEPEYLKVGVCSLQWEDVPNRFGGIMLMAGHMMYHVMKALLGSRVNLSILCKTIIRFILGHWKFPFDQGEFQGSSISFLGSMAILAEPSWAFSKKQINICLVSDNPAMIIQYTKERC